MAYYGQNISSVTKHLAWEADTAVKADELRRTTLLGAAVVLRSNSDRTTRPTFDTLEAGNWTYVGQDKHGTFAVSEKTIAGMLISDSTFVFRRLNNSTTSATDFDNDYLDWEQVGVEPRQEVYPDFSGNVAIETDVVTLVVFTQTTAGVIVSLNDPITVAINRTLTAQSSATSTVPITLSGAEDVVIEPDETIQMTWNGAGWKRLKEKTFTTNKEFTLGAAMASGEIVRIGSNGEVFPYSTQDTAISASYLPVLASSPANPTVAFWKKDRFVNWHALSGGTARAKTAKIDKATTTLNLFGNSAFSEEPATGAIVAGTPHICYSDDSSIGVIAVPISTGWQIVSVDHGGELLRGYTSNVVMTSAQASSTLSSRIVPTKRTGTYLVFGPGTPSGQAIYRLEAYPYTGQPPQVTASSFTIPTTLGSAKRTNIIRLSKKSDVYLVLYIATGSVYKATTISYNSETEVFAQLAIDFTLPSSAVGVMEAEVVYENETEVQIVYTEGTGGGVGTILIDKTTGNMVVGPQATLTADVVVSASKFITPVSLAEGRFLFSYVVGTTSFRSGEFTIHPTTGVITTVTAPAVVATLPAAIQANNFGWPAHSGNGHGVKSIFTTGNTGMVAVGKNQTILDEDGYAGILVSGGALGAVREVALKGNVATGFTGLTAGTLYYIDASTNKITASVTSRLAGRAVSATELLVL
jgi:hypothetical protein